MINDKDLVMSVLDRWVNARVGEFTRNRPFITPLAQRYVHNMISPYKSYLKGMFNEEGKFDEEMLSIMAYPFNDNVDPIRFKVLDSEFLIENGNIYFDLMGNPAVVNKRDVMELLSELEKLVQQPATATIKPAT